MATNRPIITLWNRLEGTPRSEDYTRALRAEIRDPLWMLSKQWQMGEFQGEDAGSAILSKVHLRTNKLAKYQAGDLVEEYNPTVPLEVEVESQKISFAAKENDISVDIRMLMGRYWIKLLRKNDVDILPEYLENYSFQSTANLPSSAEVAAHLESWQLADALTQNYVDGYQVYRAIRDGTDTIDHEKLPALREQFTKWYKRIFYQHQDENKSWKPSYLEHQFSCSASSKTGEKVLVSDEYYHGHLDWYNLDINNKKSFLALDLEESSAEETHTLTFLPNPISFPGMPHARWWTFEDWRVNLGKMDPNTTDINQVLLLDFVLNYSNDWFIQPFTLPIGTISDIEGMMVTNVFGENIWIKPADRGQDEDWKERWSMFKHNVRGDMDVPGDTSLFLAPAAPKIHESKPFEEVCFIRDEMANMVWGIESVVPLATGKGKVGKEAARELRAKMEEFIEREERTPDYENDAKIKYQIMNSVPENWIPLIPVHQEGSFRQIQLQRAAMPRIYEGDKNCPRKIEPRTSLLRKGLDKDSPEPYFIHEEEIPRAGIKVTKSYQRTRWFNGKVFNWIGIRKKVGRGEGHSGLAFDQIVPKG